jgi:RNA polymerase sigma-70 factor (ECF subfamily)
MAHLAEGHGDAIAVLLDRYLRLVQSIATRLVRNFADAQEVAQEVFLDTCRTAARFDPAKGTTKMWIVRTAYRRSLNRRRYLSFREVQSLAEGQEQLKAPMAGGGWVSSRLSAYEAERLVRQMLARLEVGQRQILQMVFFDGLRVEEVAEKTGATLDSVRHRYYRGLEKLRQMMDEDVTRQALTRPEEVPNAGS